MLLTGAGMTQGQLRDGEPSPASENSAVSLPGSLSGLQVSLTHSPCHLHNLVGGEGA